MESVAEGAAADRQMDHAMKPAVDSGGVTVVEKEERLRTDRPERCATAGLRAPASCHDPKLRGRSHADSSNNWMRYRGHVMGDLTPS